MKKFSVSELSQRLAAKEPITLLDVRKTAALQHAARLLSGAQWRDPALWLDWKDRVASDRPVVVYCAHGQEISQALATALQVMGRDAGYLVGGFGAWEEAGLPTQPLPTKL